MKLGLFGQVFSDPDQFSQTLSRFIPDQPQKIKKKNEMSTFYKMSFSCKSLMLLTGHQGLGQFYKEMHSLQI
jgi:hypothetical protein